MSSCDSITVSSTWELTSISMRYSQGDGVNTSLSRITYCTHVVYTSPCLILSCVPFLYVCSVARSCATKGASNKDNVWKSSIPAGIKCPPPSKTISPITWFGAISTGAIVLSPTDATSQEAMMGLAQRFVVARARTPRDVAVQHCVEYLSS